MGRLRGVLAVRGGRLAERGAGLAQLRRRLPAPVGRALAALHSARPALVAVVHARCAALPAPSLSPPRPVLCSVAWAARKTLCLLMRAPWDGVHVALHWCFQGLLVPRACSVRHPLSPVALSEAAAAGSPHCICGATSH